MGEAFLTGEKGSEILLVCRLNELNKKKVMLVKVYLTASSLAWFALVIFVAVDVVTQIAIG